MTEYTDARYVPAAPIAFVTAEVPLTAISTTLARSQNPLATTGLLSGISTNKMSTSALSLIHMPVHVTCKSGHVPVKLSATVLQKVRQSVMAISSPGPPLPKGNHGDTSPSSSEPLPTAVAEIGQPPSGPVAHTRRPSFSLAYNAALPKVVEQNLQSYLDFMHLYLNHLVGACLPCLIVTGQHLHGQHTLDECPNINARLLKIARCTMGGGFDVPPRLCWECGCIQTRGIHPVIQRKGTCAYVDIFLPAAIAIWCSSPGIHNPTVMSIRNTLIHILHPFPTTWLQQIQRLCQLFPNTPDVNGLVIMLRVIVEFRSQALRIDNVRTAWDWSYTNADLLIS